MLEPVLNVQERLAGKRSVLTKLRNEGFIPAILYGKNVASLPVAVAENELQKQIREHGRNAIFQVEVQGQKQKVLIREVQIDKVTNKMIHVDLMAIDEETEVDTTVPVHLVGEAVGVREGGIVQHLLHELEITAKAEEIPEKIDIDISELDIGDTILVEQIAPNYSFKINHEGTEPIVTILPPETSDAETDTGEESTGTQDENPEV